LNCVNHYKLQEVRTIGHAFIWSNRHVAARVYSKFDRALMTEEPLLAFPEVLYEILPEDVSNHNPLQLTLCNVKP